jgi:hypothetical protein
MKVIESRWLCFSVYKFWRKGLLQSLSPRLICALSAWPSEAVLNADAEGRIRGDIGSRKV